MAGFGATFVPGGHDDYYMPEVVAPAPQRVTPQVPQNMQDDLQRMELEASSPDQHSHRNSHATTGSGAARDSNSYDDGPPRLELAHLSLNNGDSDRSYQEVGARSNAVMPSEAPNFSPFPKVEGDNAPPTDDEKEEILWKARDHVLHSQNVPMQITWARDVLAWAEIAMEAAQRDEKPRPSTPRIEHELRRDAIQIISYLAEQEHPQALYIQAKWLEFGKFGHRVDKRDAYNGYKRAAELGNARSEYRIGMLFEQSNDMAKAKEHYYKGMALKDSAALYRMGMMSLLGQHGEHKDFAAGIQRIRAAADLADEDAPQGAFVYGMLAARDLPDIAVPDALLPQNLTTARLYVEKSAYLGFAKAQLKMGQAFELCQLGCEFHASYSLHYYGLAAKQGLPEAALGVSRWFLFGYEGVFKKNEELAYKYALEAAAARLPTGEFAMGYYNEIGIHVGKNISEARRWYQLAADHGNTDAVGRLDSLSEDKTLSKKDHETTTLTRIKSQHGSQRGKRPDRFKQPQQMPTLSEGRGSRDPTPAQDQGPGVPPKPHSSGPSPSVSPGLRPTVVQGSADFPDPSRASYGNVAPNPASDRAPAFNIRLDNNNPSNGPQPPRPSSAAPYPVDDQPPPLNVRPRSTAPYPDEQGPPAPYPHHQRLNPSGPQADRPGSAFGIKTGGPRPMPASQSMGNLHPQQQPPPSHHAAPHAGRGGPGPGYRHSSGGGGPPPSHSGPSQRPVSAQTTPERYPMPGGLPPSPSPNGPIPQRIPPQQQRPVSEAPPHHSNSMPLPGRPGAGAHQRPPTAQPQGRPVPSQVNHLAQGGPGPRTGSAPPTAPHKGPSGGGAGGGSGSHPGSEHRPTPPPAAVTQSAPPPAKTGSGPATFEAMGIPQGKQDSDCVVM